jgi:hypothetical protein
MHDARAGIRDNVELQLAAAGTSRCSAPPLKLSVGRTKAI